MADTKVSELGAASALTGAELFHVVQSAADAKATVGQVRRLNVSSQSSGFTLSPGSALYVRYTGSSAGACTIDTSASWVAGEQVLLRQVGTGALSVTAGSGVTINVPDGHTAAARAQGSTLALVYAGSDTWDLTGDLA